MRHVGVGQSTFEVEREGGERRRRELSVRRHQDERVSISAPSPTGERRRNRYHLVCVLVSVLRRALLFAGLGHHRCDFPGGLDVDRLLPGSASFLGASSTQKSRGTAPDRLAAGFVLVCAESLSSLRLGVFAAWRETLQRTQEVDQEAVYLCGALLLNPVAGSRNQHLTSQIRDIGL